ncbi:MAG TPA: hypothetical protein PKV42_02210 [Thiobacillus sp.]|nr:MAG: hypothetical protein B7Y27_01515 [Hydrogenophilales bacterium 16-64-40]OZA35236.1 MAG: hypothetical protein B7X82_01905 [Hydrogenophilales bacterium 17-64-65]HQS81251.1 hypothetical protein [Thiobacillus sp.]HQT32462.1 hypothetical protein [Thiobacillus sp.]
MPTDTIKQLAAITDAAQFERIATSVLRSAKPSLYANLSHQGVNADGKTVKAPLDNVGWVRIDGDSMFVAAAHTTASRDDLEGKWLHDPATVAPRKGRGTPTQPAGDLLKAIGELQKLRVASPGLKASIALTCNREEPADVRVKAEALAATAGVSLDVWSVSRIAQYLDTTADGQAIRHAYLGMPAVLLSKAELLRAGQLSLDARTQPTDPASIVDRAIQLGGTGHVILSGASGMGKTTLCLELLRTSLANGQAGLVLSEQTVSVATSIEEAIDMELRRYIPHLDPFAGSKALELCGELTPLVIVIEDINRAENTVGLLNKVVGWALRSISKEATRFRSHWRLLCPVWPRFLPAIEKSKDAYSAGIIQTIGLYSDKEASEAVKRHGEALGKPQGDMSATAIARALSRDPLLIGLYDFKGTGLAQDVIAEYVAREFAGAALSAGLTESDVDGAVGRLAIQMLENKCLDPTWNDALGWLNNEDDKKALRALVSKGSLLRLTRVNGKETIETRHDRVLHSLLAAEIATRLATGTEDAYLSDPYFAEFAGTGAVLAELADSDLQRLMQESPLTAFFALKDAVSRNSDYTRVAADVIENWLALEETLSPAFFSRRWRALGILAEIDSPVVLDLTEKFPPVDRHQPLFEARFRNGDLGAALNWLTEYPFEVSVGGRQELVDYVRSRSGVGLIRGVAAVLASRDSQPRAVLGALYLAGYLADPALAQSVRTAWNGTNPDERNLEAFLWAAARVCGDEAAITLGPVCDAWAALPEPDDHALAVLSRSSLAAYGVSWKFRDHLPCAAVPYFVERAANEELRWPITYMLRGIDDPIAVQHMAEYLADLSRQTEGKGGFIDSFVKDEWRRLSDEQGRPMSTASKSRLLDLATDTRNDKHIRKQAFAIWEVSVGPDDVAIARAIPHGDLLHDTAVWARARRQDFSVIPELVEKIKTKSPAYWWQAGRYIWTDTLTALLDESIQKLGRAPLDQHENLGEWIFPEHLLRLEIPTAQQILIKHWDQVRGLPRFVQVALFLATPELVSLANEAIAATANKKAIFEHFSFTTGLRTLGRTGVTREAQLEVLQPYLGLLSEHDLFALWETCNRGKWKRYRREHLDPLLIASESKITSRLRSDPPFDMSDLDKELSGEPSFAYLWLDMRQRDGAEREALLDALLTWVREKSNVAALEVAGGVYSREASRAEFHAFEQLASTLVGSEHVLKQVHFDIFNRTLS